MKLAYCPQSICHRKMAPGFVKRTLPTGGLVGYWIACPGCGRVRAHLDSEVTFIETTPPPGGRRELLGSQRPMICDQGGCGRRIRVDDGQIEAVDVT